MKVLIGGFRGNTNSASMIVDKITSENDLERIHLVNSFETSKTQLENLLQKQYFDLIIIFGQKPKVTSLYLECQADLKGNKLVTKHKYDLLEKMLNNSGFTTVISRNAGSYLCNHIFYVGLKHTQNNNLDSELLFIHIPSFNNIENINILAQVFSTYIDQFFK